MNGVRFCLRHGWRRGAGSARSLLSLAPRLSHQGEPSTGGVAMGTRQQGDVTIPSRKYPTLPQCTVGVVVLRKRRDDELERFEALLVERKNPPAQNTLAFPGGRLDLGERLEDCARREVKEETNIDLCDSFPLSQVTTIAHVARDDDNEVKYHYVIVEYVGLASENSVIIPGDDAASVDWATLDEIDSKNILDKRAHKEVLEKALRTFDEVSGGRC